MKQATGRQAASKKATKKKAVRRAADLKARPADVSGDALARELAGIPGFEKGRRLRAQIIELGDKLRVLRKDVLEINQTLAAKLIGMEQPELSRIENGVGERGPSYSTITRIIEAYETYLQSQNAGYHLGLNIQLRREDTEEIEQQFLAGSA